MIDNPKSNKDHPNQDQETDENTKVPRTFSLSTSTKKSFGTMGNEIWEKKTVNLRRGSVGFGGMRMVGA